ncbi:MAG: DUF4340 domain-containing protein [Candidatus Aminicenantes bacterium]|nr:DUF4340 domain-containing protein [Candidatus Aminicenantes bacterium]
MKLKQIGSLVVILAVLFILIHMVNKQEVREQESAGRLLNLKPEMVKKIELLRGEKTFRFVKQNHGWYLEEPVKTRADKRVIESILDDFCALKYERPVESNTRDLKKYGLGQPKIQLRLYEDKKPAPSFTIQLGNQNSMDSTSYTKLERNNDVVLITAYKRDQLEKDLFDFRDKKFFHFEQTEVKRLSFKSQEKEFVFKKKNNTWFLEKPLFSLTSEIVLSDIVSSASQLKAKAFVAVGSPGHLKTFGVDTPLVELKLSLEKGEKILKILRKEDKLYGYSLDFPEICEIEEKFIDQFNKELDDFREHKVARFYAFDVQEMTYSGDGLTVGVRKSNDFIWNWINPLTKKQVNGDKVNDFLTAIQDLEADSFLDQPTGAESFSFFLEMKLDDENNEDRTKTVQLSFSRSKEDFILVKNRDLPYLFRISSDFIGKLPQKLEDFIKKEK